MALGQRPIVSASVASDTANKRVVVHEQLDGIFGTDATEPTLALTTPIGFDTSVNKYGEWMAPDPTVLEIDTGGAAGGTFGITINGYAFANTTFAYNVTAAALKAQIKAAGFDVTVALDSGVYTITFDGDPEVTTLPTVVGDVTKLTGDTNSAATATAGTATNGKHIIKGFVYPYEITLDDTKDTPGMFMSKGRISYNDIVDTVAVGDVTALETALKNNLVAAGFEILDLPGRH